VLADGKIGAAQEPNSVIVRVARQHSGIRHLLGACMHKKLSHTVELMTHIPM
jgi:hypothetical protein